MDAMKLFKPLEIIFSPFNYLLTRKMAHYLYQKTINKILTDLNYIRLSGRYKPVDLMMCREFRGLINSLLEPDGYYYSVTDIAVAINISTSHFSENTFDRNSHEIIDFSYHILSEIKASIIKNKIINEGLKNYNKDVNLIDTNSVREGIEYLFRNKKELFKHYFSTFNGSRYNHRFKIWHQSNDNTWVDWSEVNSTDININPYKIREGFFLVGFDYSDITQGERLQVASNKGGYDFFNKFIDQKSCIWMK
ncbi:hypothetical protein AB8970_20910 [Yersinia enterocolitica]|uniref:hypothetical protein n=1 Tax=Yersinia enterocolitica TaxID=630 RepID=UPI003D02ECE9